MNQREIILVQCNGNLTDIFRCFNYFKTSGISLEVPNDLEIKIKLLNNLILAKEEQEKFFLTEMSDNFLQEAEKQIKGNDRVNKKTFYEAVINNILQKIKQAAAAAASIEKYNQGLNHSFWFCQ